MPTATLNDLDALRSKKAQKALRAYYHKLKVKSWQKVADHFGLTNKTRAWMIAAGRLKVTAEMWAAMARHLPVRAPKKFLRQVRRVAVPFLANRQMSKQKIYSPGGKPVESTK